MSQDILPLFNRNIQLYVNDIIMIIFNKNNNENIFCFAKQYNVKLKKYPCHQLCNALDIDFSFNINTSCIVVAYETCALY